MAEETAIEWADSTFNPWEGCQKVGPGCDHCYAETRNARYVRADDPAKGTAPNWGPGAPRRRTSVSNWNKPIRWQREADAFYAEHGRRRRVFCSSLADVFDNAVDPQWRSDLARLIEACPSLEWLLLTKRIGNALNMLIEMFPEGVPVNVRVGATIVNQDEAARDMRKVAQIYVATHLKPFLSIEPILGPIDFAAVDPAWQRYIGWVIVGGESGADARRADPWAVRSIRDQCLLGPGVPFLFKQWGEWGPVSGGSPMSGDIMVMNGDGFLRSGTMMRLVGKKTAGRILDGTTHTEFPR